MNDLQLIQSKIYNIREQRVMLDFDLANLYQVETRRLNEAVKRNIKRFPSDFMFQFTPEEWEILMSQSATSRWGGTRKMPYAFTHEGLSMLSGVLNSDIAIQVNINIMRAFTSMRKILQTTPTSEMQQLLQKVHQLEGYIEETFADYNDINEDTRVQLELINQTLAQLQAKTNRDERPRTVIKGFTKETEE